MNKARYELIEAYMKQCMTEAAHDKEHVYRVLYAALDIAASETNVDYDVLVAACLLHDIGRREQQRNPALDHAEVGGDMAHVFLVANGFEPEFAERVRECIAAHRFRVERPPQSSEAMILFDADKLDAVGAMGVARTLVYRSTAGESLYSLDIDGLPTTGEGEREGSFFSEYHHKLKKLYDRFYTRRGQSLAAERRAAAENFYNSLSSEIRVAYETGLPRLKRLIE